MISFVVLHYLVAKETIHCVDSILNNVKGEFNIVIVDNDSPNNSYTELSNYYHDNLLVTVLKNHVNGGYASGINFGYQFAKKEYNPDFIIAMNNDMEIVQSDFCEKLFSIFNRTNFYVLGPDIYSTSALKHQNPEKSTIITIADIDEEVLSIHKMQKQQFRLKIKSILRQSSFIESNYYKLKLRFKGNKKQTQELTNITLHGSCYIFSKLFIQSREYALFPKTKFYCEAQILDYECKRDGMKQVYSPEVFIYHHEDIATNAVEGGYAEKMNKKYKRVLESLNIFRNLILQDQGK